MTTELERQRLRLDLGLNAMDVGSLSDADADAIFIEAGELYTSSLSILATTRIIAIQRLLVQSAVEVDYTENNSTEKASQRFDHLRAILTLWKERLTEAVVLGQGSAARFGRTTRKPARVREYPDDGSFPWGW